MKLKFNAVYLIAFVAASSFSVNVHAQPCKSGYAYRTAVVVNNSAAALSDYQIKINLNTASLVSSGKMNNLGRDIRVLDNKGNELSYWIADGTMNTTSTDIWVKTPILAGYGTDTLFFFYGNSSATAKSDASKTFDLYDDFNGTTLSSKWTTCGSGSASVSGGNLNLSTSSNTIQVTATSALNVPLIFEASIASFSGATTLIGQTNSSGNGYASGISTSGVTMDAISSSSCISRTTLSTSGTSFSKGLVGFAWASTGSQKANWNGTNYSSSNTTYNLPSGVTPFLAITSGSGSATIENIRARKYASATPSTNMLAEVHMNYTISPTYGSPLCEDGTLELTVDTVVGATYVWVGPNSFYSTLQHPTIAGVTSSDAGRYGVTVNIPSGCASKSSSVNVNISPKAKGGSVAGTQTVCSGTNNGILSLSGHTGNVARWDSATSASGPWYPISNTQLNQTYTNLTTSTFYRAIVTNGNCSLDSSTYAKISVSSPSKGGSLSGSTAVCSGSNSGVITLSAYTGVIVRWEYSENGNLWYSIVNKSSSQAYTNLTKTMYYRAVVQNGNCNVDYSSVAIIGIDLPSVGGNASGSTTVCPDVNSGVVTVGGHLGSVIAWEQKEVGSTSWQSISVASDSLTYSNISQSTQFRAVVRNGSCATTESSVVLVSVYTKSNAGKLAGGTTVCEGSNSGTLTLTGTNGNIVKWQERSNSSSWKDISSTKTTHNWYNLTDTTHYRAIATNSGCKPDTSTIEVVQVDPESLNGYISGTEKVCVSGNSVQLKLSGYRGDIEKWEWSETGYTPWTSGNAASETLSKQNLSKSLYYRAVVKNGVCPKATTANYLVTVDAETVSGTVGPDSKVCEGSNFGIINLTGTTGDVLKWQSASSPSGSWSNISNATQKQEFQNLNATTYYRAVVQNGSCLVDTSNVTAISVSKYTVAGTLTGEAGYCSKTNDGYVKLVNYSGEIQSWEKSTNSGSQWTTMNINTDQFTYTDLAVSTMYRVVIKSGACAQLTSNLIQIEIADPSFAGDLVTSDNVLCKESNFGTVNASNVIGQILLWEYKEDGGSWQSVANTTTQQSYFNLTTTTAYRTIVRNKFCDVDTSVTFRFDISEPTEGGTISGTKEVCTNTDDVVLTLNNFTGSIDRWQSSKYVSGPWSDEANSTATMTIDKPTESNYYRAKVTSGVCPTAYSAPFGLTVYEYSIGGLTTGDAEICSGKNNGTVELKGQLGDVQGWQQREVGSSVWTDVDNKSTSMFYENLTATTDYRAVVQNGVCDVEQSMSTTLVVNPNPVVDISYANLCDGIIIPFKQETSITSGYIQSFVWKFSDGFTSYQDQFDKSFLIPGKYTLSLTAESDKSCSSTYEKELIVGETPVVNFSILNGLTPNTGCLNESIDLQNNTVHADASSLSFEWNFDNGSTSTKKSPEVVFDQPGTYRIVVIATSRAQCIDSMDREFVVFEEHKTYAGEDVEISKGIAYQLMATGSVGYTWTPADKLNDYAISNPMATITETTEFEVTGTDYFGCRTQDAITLSVLEDYSILANNVITPDGNGENDVWVIKNIETYPENHVMVFDRWGREVYSVDSYKNDWGATDREGRVLMDGTYYYVLEFPEVNKVVKGAITVIKNR